MPLILPVTNDCPRPPERAASATSWPSYLLCASQKAFSCTVYLQDGDCLSYYFPFLLPQFPVALQSLFSLGFFSFFSLLAHHRLPFFFFIFCPFFTIIRGFPHCSLPLPSLPFLCSLLSFFCLALSAHQSHYDSGEQLAEKGPAGLCPGKSPCCWWQDPEHGAVMPPDCFGFEHMIQVGRQRGFFTSPAQFTYPCTHGTGLQCHGRWHSWGR